MQNNIRFGRIIRAICYWDWRPTFLRNLSRSQALGRAVEHQSPWGTLHLLQIIWVFFQHKRVLTNRVGTSKFANTRRFGRTLKTRKIITNFGRIVAQSQRAVQESQAESASHWGRIREVLGQYQSVRKEITKIGGKIFNSKNWAQNLQDRGIITVQEQPLPRSVQDNNSGQHRLHCWLSHG